MFQDDDTWPPVLLTPWPLTKLPLQWAFERHERIVGLFSVTAADPPHDAGNQIASVVAPVGADRPSKSKVEADPSGGGGTIGYPILI